MSWSTLQDIWFLLVGILLLGYTVLDGFDLGVGIWYLFTKRDEERRVLLNSIGPFWDGNEVWLLTGGGALFAAFPHVYATVFSGLYLALMLVLFSLIVRAVSIEFRHHEESQRARRSWDVAFSLGSALPALLFGVALGNMLRGLPLDAHMNFTGTFFSLLNPYALLIGLTGFAMIALYGALYVALRTTGNVAGKAAQWAWRAWIAYLALLLAAHVATVATQGHLLRNPHRHPVLWAVPVLSLLAAVLPGLLIKRGRVGLAFLATAASMALNWATCAVGLYPRLVPALGHPEWSLTIANASSSAKTLGVMAVLALLGVPVVLGYTYWVYKTFWGKLTPQEAGPY